MVSSSWDLNKVQSGGGKSRAGRIQVRMPSKSNGKPLSFMLGNGKITFTF